MDIYEKQLTCPVCGATVRAPFVKSSAIYVEKRDTDLCVYYKGVNPLLYDVIVCGECGYAALNKNFGKFTKWDIESLREKVQKKWVKREIPFERTVDDAIVLYKLALITATSKKKVNKYEVAGILLRISWLYRLNQDREKELEFQKMSLQAYKDAFENDEGTQDEIDLATVMYLIGELSRRTGDLQEAKKWFSRLITSKEARSNPHILELAREQIQAIKDLE
ncbi:DUF2225 domain-containing protein [Caldicellulosiruptor morganii]|uniref:DUF2225 domain-containing protein n=1 Tax=Caldicellulosiruptor morganii TaxID=1387555 RepID=A0ABY7BJW6_9FIRM|nr:DUF2225 domain-containing protein [Caldicellulosiruptor morganii]WAM33138.1 DUF2225 domain-containing protein [Caldicellulosiruptor morganii]